MTGRPLFLRRPLRADRPARPGSSLDSPLSLTLRRPLRRGGRMARRVARLTLDTLADLPEAARSCVQWELDPVTRHRLPDRESAMAEKEAWVSHVLLDWGSCGRVVYVDEQPAGFVV